MLHLKIKNIKARKSFEKIERVKKIEKFLFINLLNARSSLEVQKIFSFFFSKKKTFKDKNYQPMRL